VVKNEPKMAYFGPISLEI